MHRNITTTPGPYPAPAGWYGPGHYYIKDMADAADADHKKSRPAPPPPETRICLQCERPLPWDARSHQIVHTDCQREYRKAQWKKYDRTEAGAERRLRHQQARRAARKQQRESVV